MNRHGRRGVAPWHPTTRRSEWRACWRRAADPHLDETRVFRDLAIARDWLGLGGTGADR